ncbi:uncharacterized protein LOC127277934 [Leptopilina boulardi]|uniref:uncharacterized protein LOC127277934 n=1 Tax=Leptopilina boulardi TaxID=63433 RepID=UPI0021F6040C|nr:uncharacterized protein LOC127277934 [Leptopilina boulardi]
MVELDETQKARRNSLVQNRANLKRRITKLSNYLKEGGVYANAEHADRHMSIIDFELTKLVQIQMELIQLEPGKNHEEEEENIYFDYEEIKVLIRRLKEPNLEVEMRNRASVNSRSGSVYSHSAPSDYLSSLPKIEAKRFDGTLENWRMYRDWFIQTIHNRENLTDAQRLDYLKRTLTGEAEKTISAFQPSDENYAVEWKLLESTYDIEYVLIFRHCDLLLETPIMKRSSADEIRKLTNHIQTQLLAMKAFGEKIENWNTIISRVILRSLDKETEREWNRSKQGNKVPNYEDILSFLREQATRLTFIKPAMTNFNNNSTNNSNGKPKNTNNKNRGPENTHSFLTSTDEKQCVICNGNHLIDKCDKFLALNTPDRIQAARKVRLCLNCFQNDHRTRFCKASHCSICKGRHNDLVHLTEEQLQSRQSSS